MLEAKSPNIRLPFVTSDDALFMFCCLLKSWCLGRPSSMVLIRGKRNRNEVQLVLLLSDRQLRKQVSVTLTDTNGMMLQVGNSR